MQAPAGIIPPDSGRPASQYSISSRASPVLSFSPSPLLSNITSGRVLFSSPKESLPFVQVLLFCDFHAPRVDTLLKPPTTPSPSFTSIDYTTTLTRIPSVVEEDSPPKRIEFGKSNSKCSSDPL